MAPAAARSARLRIWLSWLCIGVGLLISVFLFYRYGGSSIPKVKWRSKWGQIRTVTFRDPDGQFLIDHRSDWEVSAPFKRFTRHTIGELIASDIVAMRHHDPLALLVILRYAAPSALSTEEWLKMARPDGPLKDAFGEKILSRAPTRLAGVPALKVAAEGPIIGGTYRLESWFIPAGPNAYRITVGAPVESFDRAAPTLLPMVRSFRFVEGKTPPAAAPPVRSSPAPAEN